ncbi:PAS domain S-box protein [Actinoplanes hulinensis]|uniref:histidine kinase n=2 Tax=Actinoplanes hulinensis TaxID=1144547 RepID=A0ABS7B4U8_9ACTN|nr:PAS domain S-box protein [Actinoplanes hulinensis]
MEPWQLAALANAIILVAYLAISLAIGRGLWRARQWRRNPLGLATAAIFFSCAVHHGSHTVHLMLPYFGWGTHSGIAMRHAFGSSFNVGWDLATAAVAVWYWTLRGRFPALVRGAAVFEDLRLRQAAEATLRASEERYRGIVETTSEGVLLLDGDGRIGYANSRFAEMLGRPAAGLPGTAVVDLVAEADRQVAERELAGALEGGTRRLEVGLLRDGGRVMWAQIALTARAGDHGVLAMVADVTEQKNVEAQLRQAQKLDAVGQLAGGVAHDFNNLLTVIDGYAALLMARADEASSRDLTMIREAATRAGALTRQLLAFSQTQATEVRVVNVVGLVTGLEEMLHRLIREDIELAVTTAVPSLPVRADPGQLEQVIVNLAVNARDAMPGGGILTIATDHVDVGPEQATQLGGRPGEYALITVADTGDGMSAEVAARIFEPFFTTKEQGKGTGLGMSTVYGIVAQADGHIRVDSEPGRGTVIEVHLPITTAPTVDIPAQPMPQELATGTETILFIEDDAAVRMLTERILRTAGYHVLSGADGRQALKIVRGNPDISLLVTDVIMPGMNGRQLADRITAMRPGLPVIFTSAHTRGVLTLNPDDPTVAFLEKPYTATGITQKVRAVLDARTASTATN